MPGAAIGAPPGDRPGGRVELTRDLFAEPTRVVDGRAYSDGDVVVIVQAGEDVFALQAAQGVQGHNAIRVLARPGRVVATVDRLPGARLQSGKVADRVT